MRTRVRVVLLHVLLVQIAVCQKGRVENEEGDDKLVERRENALQQACVGEHLEPADQGQDDDGDDGSHLELKLN